MAEAFMEQYERHQEGLQRLDQEVIKFDPQTVSNIKKKKSNSGVDLIQQKLQGRFLCKLYKIYTKQESKQGDFWNIFKWV